MRTKKDLAILGIVIPVFTIVIIIILFIVHLVTKDKDDNPDKHLDCRDITESSDCKANTTCRWDDLTSKCINSIDCSAIKAKDCYKHYSCQLESGPEEWKCINTDKLCSDLGANVCDNAGSCTWTDDKCIPTDIACEFITDSNACIRTDRRCYWDTDRKCLEVPDKCSDIIDQGLCEYSGDCTWFDDKCWDIPDYKKNKQRNLV